MTISRLGTIVAGAALLSVSLACTDPKAPPPDAPIFDVDTERFEETENGILTRLGQITLTGTAEYGAKLELTRKPAFKGARPVLEGSAHPYTGEFEFANVPLEVGVNEFELVAEDWRGERSEPAKLVVKYDPQPGGLTLTLSSSSVIAGPGSNRGHLTATARFDVSEEEAAAFADLEVEFEVTGAVSQTRIGVTDERGVATVEFTHLDVAGEATVEARYGDFSSTAEFVIHHGPAAVLTMGLSAKGHDGPDPKNLTVPAGTVVDVHTTLTDTSGNPITAPVAISTDATGATVTGKRIGNLRVAGQYRVVAAVVGGETEGDGGVSAEATLTVVPGKPRQIELSAPQQVVAGSPFTVSTRVIDEFGNLLPEESGDLVLTSDDPQASISPAGSEHSATFRTAGTRTLSVSLPDSDLSEELEIQVLPAAPAKLFLALSSPNAIDGATLTVRADENARIEVQATAEDEFGNPVNPAIDFTTTYAGLAVVDGAVSPLEIAGQYKVAATLPDRTVGVEASFVVVPAEPAEIEFALERSIATAGEPVAWSGRLRDRFGNTVEGSITVESDDVTITADSSTVVIEEASEADNPWTLRATASDLDLDPVEATLHVVPAAPGSLTLALLDDTVQAGDEPEVETTVTDRFGNRIDDADIEFSVLPLSGTHPEPPGPYVLDNRVKRLVRTGQYRVTAWVAGTHVATEPDAPEHVLTVEPAAPAAVVLETSDTSTFVRWPVTVSIRLLDRFDNDVPDTSEVVVSVYREDERLAVLSESTWLPTEPGDFILLAELEVDDGTLTDEVTVSVGVAPDRSPPTITLLSPTGHRTIASWPPEDAPPAANCDGVQVVAMVEDHSEISSVWFRAGGVADVASRELEPPAGTAELALEEDLCTNNLSDSTRGEVLVEVAAVDNHGHFNRADGSWCIDPDAETYVPSESPFDRCAIERDSPEYANTQAIAASRSGKHLVLAVINEGTVALRLVPRFPYDGPATPHDLVGHTMPASVAITGNTAFTATRTSTGAAVVRTVGLTTEGGGTSQTVVEASTSTHQFHSVLLDDDGVVYTAWARRTGSTGGSRVDRFDVASVESAVTFDPDSTPAFAESSSLLLTHLCGFAKGDVLAAGRNTIGRPVLARVSEGNISTIWNGTTTRVIRGCAGDDAGVVLNLEWPGAETETELVHIDLTQKSPVASDVFRGFSATAPTWTAGPTLYDGLFYFVTEDGPVGGALLRLSSTPEE